MTAIPTSINLTGNFRLFAPNNQIIALFKQEGNCWCNIKFVVKDSIGNILYTMEKCYDPKTNLSYKEILEYNTFTNLGMVIVEVYNCPLDYCSNPCPSPTLISSTNVNLSIYDSAHPNNITDLKVIPEDKILTLKLTPPINLPPIWAYNILIYDQNNFIVEEGWTTNTVIEINNNIKKILQNDIIYRIYIRGITQFNQESLTWFLGTGIPTIKCGVNNIIIGETKKIKALAIGGKSPYIFRWYMGLQTTSLSLMDTFFDTSANPIKPIYHYFNHRFLDAANNYVLRVEITDSCPIPNTVTQDYNITLIPNLCPITTTNFGIS